MNLKEYYGASVWLDATTVDVLKSALDEVEGGAVESHSQQIEMLAEMFGRLLDELNLSDTRKLEIIGGWRWELDKKGE